LLTKPLSVKFHAFKRSGVFPFLRLPAEIRNMIHHYVWYATSHADITWLPPEVTERRPSILPRPTKPSMDRPNLSLLYVSRQLHHETALLPYKLTMFVFPVMKFLYDQRRVVRLFLWKRSRAQIKALSDLRFHYYTMDGEWVEKSGNGAYWMETLGTSETNANERDVFKIDIESEANSDEDFS